MRCFFTFRERCLCCKRRVSRLCRHKCGTWRNLPCGGATSSCRCLHRTCRWRRGSAYHADVAIGGLYEQIVSVSTVEGFQFQFAAGCQGDAFGLGEAVGYCFQVFGRQIIGAVRVVVGFQLFVYVVCHVQYPVDVGDGESLAGSSSSRT